MPDDAEKLRELESQRRAAFVAGDVPVLQALHADDFHLINPAGQELNRDEYVGGVAAGFITYSSWEPETEVQVRVYGDAAVVRYRGKVVIAVKGQEQPMQRFWQTEVYENRDGKWQVVLSQSTRYDP